MAGWHATWGIAHTRIAYKLFSLGKAAEKGVVTTYHRISVRWSVTKTEEICSL